MKFLRPGWLRWALVMIIFVGLMPSFNEAKAQDTNSTALIDLHTDNNNDGLPDELVAEVLQIRDTAESVSSANAEEQTSTLQHAMTSLFARLPYSVQTRSAQAQLGDLQNELLTTEDLSQRMNLVKEMEALNSQMMEDPGYATTIHTLDVLLNEQKIDTPSYRFSLYLPMIAATSFTGNTGVASEVRNEAQDKLQKMQPVKNASVSTVNAGPAWNSLSAGDTLFIRGSWWDSLLNRIAYCNRFCHAGTYNGNQMVFESNPPKDGKKGVELRPIADWQQRGAYVGLALTRTTTYAQDRAALNWAKTKWNTNGTTQYNYNFVDKWTDSKLYCSQLVWKQLRYNGKEVDSNNWAYLLSVYARWGLIGYTIAYNGVMPDEVALANDISIWSEGTNP